MANNDNSKRAGSHEVSRALAALSGLAAPDSKIKWQVAEQRWQWAIKEINVVIEHPAATPDQLVEAMWCLAGWGRYIAFYHPKLRSRAKGELMDQWLALSEPLERLAAMEAQ
jgi:hypothetical protein